MVRFNVKKLFIKINSPLCINDAKKRIENLLTYENVDFSVQPNSIRSTYIPIPLVNFDKRLYTRKNWVGINPFIYISGLEILFTELSATETRIEINIDQRRAIFFYCMFLCLVFLVALALPTIWASISCFLFIAISSYLLVFLLCIKKLLRYEILKVLNGPSR